MSVGKGVGTTLKKGLTTIGKLTSINPGEKSWETADITTLDSANEYKESLPTIKDGGEVVISGFLNVSDSGQMELDTAFEAGTKNSYTITYPTTIGAEITFDGYVTKFKSGEANLSDGVAFEATIKVDGKPNIGTSASTGASDITFVQTDGSTALTAADFNPAFAIDEFIYGFTFTTQTSFKVKPTAASHTIKVYVDNVYTETLASGSAGTAIAISANDSKKIDVVVYEAGKTSKTYSFTVSRLS